MTSRVDGQTDQRRLKAILALVAAVAFTVLSYTAPDFTGYTRDQLPQLEARPAINPAGYAFAIWGVIYAWLIVSAGYGLLRRAEAADWDHFRWPLIASTGLGASWIYVALTDATAATVLIWIMLGLALWALARMPARDPWLARVPVGLYAGWLTAAGSVSLGQWLAGMGILPSSQIAAFVMIPVAAAIAIAVLLRLHAGGGYAFAAAWGLVAIAVENWGRDWAVVTLSLLAAVVLAVVWWKLRMPGQPA